MPGFRDTWAPVLAGLAAPLVAELAQGPGGAWLDLGCGVGTLAREVDAHSPPGHGPTIGVDLFRDMLVAARPVHPRLAPVQADAARLPFREGVFGRVMAAFMLHHVREQWRALAEVHRVLRPDGLLGVVTWGRADPGGPAWEAWEECLARAGAPARDPAPPVAWREAIDTPERLRNLLDDLGFHTHRAWQEVGEWHWTPATLADYLVRLGGTARRLETLPPERQAACRAAGRAALERLAPGDLAWRPEVVFALAEPGQPEDLVTPDPGEKAP